MFVEESIPSDFEEQSDNDSHFAMVPMKAKDPRSPRKGGHQRDDAAEENMYVGVMDENDCKNLDLNTVHDTDEEKVTIIIDSGAAA